MEWGGGSGFPEVLSEQHLLLRPYGRTYFVDLAVDNGSKAIFIKALNALRRSLLDLQQHSEVGGTVSTHTSATHITVEQTEV